MLVYQKASPISTRLLESGRWDLNPRPSPWQGDVLPLNYARGQGRQGLNPQPAVLETAALPIELHSFERLREEG